MNGMVELSRFSYVFITHKDIDGLISAYFLIRRLMNRFELTLRDVWIIFSEPERIPDFQERLKKYKEVYRVIITDPSQIHNLKLNLEECRGVYVTDIGVDKDNPGKTFEFIEILKKHRKLKKWFDHHKGWPDQYRDDPRIVINEKVKSCAESIGGPKEKDFLEAANYCDSRIGDSPLGEAFDQALKLDFNDFSMKIYILKYLLGLNDATRIIKAQKEYQKKVFPKTLEVIENGKWEDNIYLMDAIEIKGRIDFTKAVTTPIKEMGADASILVYKSGNDMKTRICKSRKVTVDLVGAFNLNAGSSVVITLDGDRREEAVKRLQKLIKYI